MEIETSVIIIAGTCYIRVPANMADYFELSNNIKKVMIKDIAKNHVEVTFIDRLE